MSKLFSQCYSPLGNAEGKNNLQMTAPITIFQKVNDADWVSAAADTILVIGMAVLVVAGVWIVSGRRAGLQKT
jgi:F0F1-type ATP synthase membrane subunit a